MALPETVNPDVIVIGAGAAGLMCAITAGRRGRSVLVLDHAQRLGQKILISGGGRCNFTNLQASPENYLSANPHFCKSALARYTPADFLRLVENHGISWHEKKLGQLFCDGSSRQIVQLLEAECANANVRIQLGCRVDTVRREHGYFLETSAGNFGCKSLVVATGGLSFQKLGATGFGHDLARQFGLPIVAPRPGLVPLTFNEADRAAYAELSGLSIDVEVSTGLARFRENLLFTHRGLSGPAILQISNCWKSPEPLSIDPLPGRDALRWLTSHAGRARELKTVLGEHLPQRFAAQWCARNAPSRPMTSFSKTELAEVASRLKSWQVCPSGTEGYAKAEVTLGGVDTAALSSKTMEAREVPGLYFIGEVVDVTGWLGGYNFQWAWASGHAAGEFV